MNPLYGDDRGETRFWLEFQVCSDGAAPDADSGPAPEACAFPRFADLPAELRLAVWDYLIQPRVVLVA